MKLKDVVEHFYNGNDVIISARYEGEEERYLFRNGIQFTKKEEQLYRKSNNTLPIIDIKEQKRIASRKCIRCGS